MNKTNIDLADLLILGGMVMVLGAVWMWAPVLAAFIIGLITLGVGVFLSLPRRRRG